MPDPFVILEAMIAAALTAAAVLLLCGWPWRKPHPARASAGSVLAVCLGFFAGCCLLGVRPSFSLREDQDRLLLVLFPAILVVELVALLPGRIQQLKWPLRLVVAAGAAPVLLHDSTYLADLAGPGSREWTPMQTGLILTSLAAVLLCVWASLVALARQTHSRSVPLAVSAASAGAALTVMLSGYASGGQIGLPLAAALVGALAASVALSGPFDAAGLLGPGVVGLFALLVIGRFFGELSMLNAGLLFLRAVARFLARIAWRPPDRAALRDSLRVVLAVAPVVAALVLAQQAFRQESAPPQPGAPEPSLQDYMDFGN